MKLSSCGLLSRFNLDLVFLNRRKIGIEKHFWSMLFQMYKMLARHIKIQISWDVHMHSVSRYKGFFFFFFQIMEIRKYHWVFRRDTNHEFMVRTSMMFVLRIFWISFIVDTKWRSIIHTLLSASTLLHVYVAPAPAVSILFVMDVAASKGEAAD